MRYTAGWCGPGSSSSLRNRDRRTDVSPCCGHESRKLVVRTSYMSRWYPLHRTELLKLE